MKMKSGDSRDQNDQKPAMLKHVGKSIAGGGNSRSLESLREREREGLWISFQGSEEVSVGGYAG